MELRNHDGSVVFAFYVVLEFIKMIDCVKCMYWLDEWYDLCMTTKGEKNFRACLVNVMSKDWSLATKLYSRV